MPVSSTYSFDSDEHYQAARAVTRLTKARWLVWGFGAATTVLVLLNVWGSWGHGPATIALNVLPWIVMGGLSVAIIPFSQKRAARRLPERDRSLQGAQRRTVDDMGYHSTGNGVALDIPWHAMVRGAETEAVFLFFYNKQCAYYLPKRALSSADAMAVRALMRSHLTDLTGLQG